MGEDFRQILQQRHPPNFQSFLEVLIENLDRENSLAIAVAVAVVVVAVVVLVVDVVAYLVAVVRLVVVVAAAVVVAVVVVVVFAVTGLFVLGLVSRGCLLNLCSLSHRCCYHPKNQV